MNAYKVEATLTKDGMFLLEGMPFRSADRNAISLHQTIDKPFLMAAHGQAYR